MGSSCRVRKVAAEAGLSMGSLRHYCASRSDLHVFAMQLVIDRISAGTDISQRGRSRGGFLIPGTKGETGWVPELCYSESIFVACSPEMLYDMISEVSRMGEWSPICRACWWDDGAGPRVGSWFTGRNETVDRTWETRSEVVAAEPGREFAFVVGNSLVRWGYTFSPTDGGTRLTESWEFLPAGIAMFRERFGDQAEAQIADRTQAAQGSIPVTLAAIKRAAEAA